jgi:hypothetical protein
MIIRQEKFPLPGEREAFKPLWDQHGIEVRGKPFFLDFARYLTIEREGRLIWIVAREAADGPPIGYSCHWWYHSMHWDERVGVDDLWFVLKGWRAEGVGAEMKRMGLSALHEAGAVETSDTIRYSADIKDLMTKLGYRRWAIKWKFPDLS